MSSFARRLLRNSSVYTATTLLQRGVAFFLLPLYTAYLSPRDYGVLAVVSSINSFLIILASFGLTGSVSRFYFTYRGDPVALATFWGTTITFTVLTSLCFGTLLLVGGETLLGPLLGGVSFWPYMALGVGAVIFQPLPSVFLNIMQTTEQVRAYAAFSLAQFVCNITLTVMLVVGLGWGVQGALLATFGTALIFYLLALVALRPSITVGISRGHLAEALHYSLPLVPHSIAGLISSTSAKLLINKMLTTTAAGLFNIAYNFASTISIITFSINRAFTPLYMGAMEERDLAGLERIREIGLDLVVGYSLLACSASIFTPEVLMLFTNPAYAGAANVTPFLAFGFAITGIYYLFVNALFFEKSATRLVALASGLDAALTLFLTWLLLPTAGLIGAGIAALLGQISSACVVAVLARPFEAVRWNYGRFIVIVALAAVVALAIFLTPFGSWPLAVAGKVVGIGLLAMALSTVAWGRPLLGIERALAAIAAMRRRPLA